MTKKPTPEPVETDASDDTVDPIFLDGDTDLFRLIPGDSIDWEKRLEEVRRRQPTEPEQRGKALSRQDSSSVPSSETSSAQAVSLENRLKAAREARKTVAEPGGGGASIAAPDLFGLGGPGAVSSREGALRPRRQTEVRPEIVPDAAPEPLETKVLRAEERVDISATSTRGRSKGRIASYLAGSAALVAALTMIFGTVPWTGRDDTVPSDSGDLQSSGDATSTVADASSSAPVLAYDPGKLDMIVVAQEGVAADTLPSEASYELRTTPFRIDRSTVQYFNVEDADAAARLAEMTDSDLVDMRGLQPAQPVGRVILYLAEDGV